MELQSRDLKPKRFYVHLEMQRQILKCTITCTQMYNYMYSNVPSLVLKCTISHVLQCTIICTQMHNYMYSNVKLHALKYAVHVLKCAATCTQMYHYVYSNVQLHDVHVHCKHRQHPHMHQKLPNPLAVLSPFTSLPSYTKTSDQSSWFLRSTTFNDLDQTNPKHFQTTFCTASELRVRARVERLINLLEDLDNRFD